MGARPHEPVTLPAFLDGLAARFGGREALVSPRRRMTYAELAAESTAIARALAARGVEAGTRVGLLMPNWPEWIATAFGVWRAGGLLVPLSTLSRPREMAYCLAHAEVRVLVAVRRFLRHDYVAGLEEGAPRLPALGEVVWLAPPGEGGAVDLAPLGAPGSPLAATVSPDDPATVFFTSGTTAEPKGVVHVHRALCRAAEEIAAVLGLAPEDRTWGYLPFFFAGGLVAVVLATLARGGAVVMQEVFEPDETLRLLEAERCTVFFAWPHQAEALIAHPRFRAARLVLRKGVGANTKWAAALYPPDHHPPAECFDAEGFFHTGDLGQLDERGALHFLGRLKDVIKTAGVNVAAAEVEAALLAHPAVGAAHVVGVPDPARGENVAAFVVAKSAVAAEELLAHCRARLSSYKVPRHLWFRREDELPEKASGKVDKAALRAEAARLVRAGGDRPATPPAPRA